MALDTNLTAYYKLDESSGNAVDSLGSNNLTNNNTVGYAAAKINNGADFGTANSNKYFSNSLALPAAAFSVSFWLSVRTAPTSGVIYTLVSWKDSVTDVRLKIEYLNDGGTLKLRFNRSKPGVADQNADYNVDLGTGTFYHVVMTYNGTTEIGYLNASSVASLAASGNGSAPLTDALEIGRNDNGTNYSNVYIDELGLWSRALTPTEVSDLYNSGSGLSYPFATNITINPSVQTATFSIPAYTPKTGNTQSPAVQTATFSVPSYTVSLPKTVTPSVQFATFSIPTYAVLAGDVLTTPATQVVTFSIPAYSVLYGTTTSPSAQVVTFSVPAYTISIAETLTPNAQVATFSIPTYAVLKGIVTAPDAQVATFSIPTYTIATETAVHPSAQVATFSVPTYSLSIGITKSLDTQVLTFSIPTLARFGAVWAKTARPTDATWSRTSRNST